MKHLYVIFLFCFFVCLFLWQLIFKEQLSPKKLGFLNVIELVGALSDILRVEFREREQDLLVFDADVKPLASGELYYSMMQTWRLLISLKRNGFLLSGTMEQCWRSRAPFSSKVGKTVLIITGWQMLQPTAFTSGLRGDFSGSKMHLDSCLRALAASFLGWVNNGLDSGHSSQTQHCPNCGVRMASSWIPCLHTVFQWREHHSLFVYFWLHSLFVAVVMKEYFPVIIIHFRTLS